MVAYREAGAGDEAVGRIARHVRSTWTPRVLGQGHRASGRGAQCLMHSAGLFQLDYPRGILRREYRDPVLVSRADGVGAKLEVAFRMGVSDTIGRDVVALCVNDLVAQGAEPLFFLHRLHQAEDAGGQSDPVQAELVWKGIAAGCREARCAMLGGETAETPGFFRPGSYELAGFAVGVAERSRLLRGERVSEGDDILGLASSGAHSSGYSLIRKVFLGGPRRWSLADRPPGFRRTLGEELLEPTRIYAEPALAVLQRYRRKQVVRALIHIARDGLTGNIPRVLPSRLDAVLLRGDWPVPRIFRLVQEAGKVPEEEMYQVFNMGVGMAMVVSPAYTDSILKQLADLRCPAFRIGRVVRGRGRVQVR